MAQIKNVPGTAFVVAEFRAEENDEAQPLYRGTPSSSYFLMKTPSKRLSASPQASRG